MESFAAEQTVRQFISEVSDQHQPMTAVVVAMVAAQAAALGEACMQISLDHQIDKLDWQDVTKRIQRMAAIKNKLLEWGELEAKATDDRTAEWKIEEGPGNQQFWCESAAEIGRLSINAATLLQDYRPLVFETVRDDLEITISMLVSIAWSALLLLDSNLNLWSDTRLREKYEPIRIQLESQLNLITPVTQLGDDSSTGC